MMNPVLIYYTCMSSTTGYRVASSSVFTNIKPIIIDKVIAIWI